MMTPNSWISRDEIVFTAGAGQIRFWHGPPGAGSGWLVPDRVFVSLLAKLREFPYIQ